MMNTRYVMRKDRGVKILAEKLSLVSYKAIFIIVLVVNLFRVAGILYIVIVYFLISIF